MLTIVLRKMMRNRWMVLCLLIGSILAVSIVSSIPMYTYAILQRMLTKDLESDQRTSGMYPGHYKVAIDFNYIKEEFKGEYFQRFDKKIQDEMIKDIGLPYVSSVKNLSVRYLSALPEIQREENPRAKEVNIDTMSGFNDHIELIAGRMYSPQKAGDAIEVIVTEMTLKENDLQLDQTYILKEFRENDGKVFKAKVVGVFTAKDLSDTYWFDGLGAYDKSLFMDYNLFNDEFVKNNTRMLTKVNWYYALDYRKIEVDRLKPLVSTYEAQAKYFDKYKGLAQFRMQAMSVIDKYSAREKELRIILWVLQSPILIMLAFYIFMVSQLMIGHEKNEIAVMRSRGASGLQIFWSYLLESVVLSLIALIVGPPLGLLLCRVLGASNGFLEFVQRTSLPLKMNMDALTYSLGAVALFMTSMLIPAFMSSRTSIVQHKQKKARFSGVAVWKKYFLDFIIFGIAMYGIYDFKHGQRILAVTGAKGTDLTINPLLFVVSSLFVLGCGLLFLRVFPYIIKLVFWLGRKRWSPVLYASFIQVGRSNGQEQFLMLFIILTLSVGLFSANSARTLNRNMEDKIRYETGADIAIRTFWENNAPKDGGFDIMDGGAAAQPALIKEKVVYQEPPFEPFTKMEGVESVTKVFRSNFGNAQVGGKTASKVYIMGIEPPEFGKTAWFRPSLLPYHWYQYLNLMTESPMAVLVSSSFRDKYKVKEGDTIYFSWGDQEYVEAVIFQFVDYWPTFNPNVRKDDKKQPDMIVANLSYLQTKATKEPYEIWIKKKPGATSAQIFKQLSDMGVELEEQRDATQQIIKKKNDPMLQGTNGALTMGFVVTIAISTIGFLIYWILSVQMRSLQFGILRAMGLKLKKVIGMLSCEQILISGTAIIMGIIIGGITSSQFVPMLQMTSSIEEQVPPFRVIAERADYLRLYVIVALMLILGIGVLWRIMSRVKISQAIKLGED